MNRSRLISVLDAFLGCILGAALLYMLLFHRVAYAVPVLLDPAPDNAYAPLWSDQTFLRVHWFAVFVLLSLGGFLVGLIGRGMLDWKRRGGIGSFTPPVILLVMIFGVIEWTQYYGDHGYFFTWPAAVLVVVLVMWILQNWILDLQRRDYAEKVQQVDKTPVFGDADEATPDDERRAGL